MVNRMDKMGDMRDVITGRSPMRRVRPLFLRLNAWRRNMEEEPEVRPGRGRGPGDWCKIGGKELQGEGRACFFREGQVLSCSGNPP